MRLICKEIVLLSIAAGGLMQPLPGAYAQTPTQTQTQTQQRSPRLPVQREVMPLRKLPGPTKYEEVVKNLDRQVEIPNMPSYPGKTRYLGGKTVSVPGVTTYSMNFLVTDPPSRVKDWYIQALSSYNWKQNLHPTATQVSGRSADGNGVTVSFSETKDAPYKSEVTIIYFERAKSK